MENDLLLKALNKEQVSRPPVWLMRQAGRYLPEYQRVRSKVSFLELCGNPELAVEVSLQPYQRFGMDAVIVFSDILLPAQKMGLELDFTDVGPRFSNPVRTEDDITKLVIPEANEENYPTLKALTMLKKEIGHKVPILGFAGAPWTMFCYMTEGGSSQSFYKSKTLLYENPQAAHTLLSKITNSLFLYLTMQANSGANVLQIFDTWAGILSYDDYCTFAMPYLKRLISDLLPLKKPLILYSNGSHHLLGKFSMLKLGALSVDWRVNPQSIRDNYGKDIGLQGNLDPAILLTNQATVRERTKEMIMGIDNWQKGYVCNLGHGILPTTPIDNVTAMIETVHELAEEPLIV